MRVVFMGTPDFGNPTLQQLHESRHQVVAVVTAPDKPSGRGLKSKPSAIKKSAQAFGYPILQPVSLKDEAFLNDIKDCFADIFVVVAFRILPKLLYSIPNFGAVNIHASLLPKYRGAAPIHHALLNDEKETGITIFQIDRKVDTGNILNQKRIKITSNDTTGTLWHQLSQLGSVAMIHTLDDLENNKITPIVQDHELSCPAPKITKVDAKIDWDQSAKNIHNQIRAFSPFPGAFSFFGKKRVKIFDSIIYLENDVDLSPGEFENKNGVFCIGTGAGVIGINSIQIEGKKRMTVSQFLVGHNLRNGVKFEK